LQTLSQHSLIIYIKATQKDEQELIRRAEADPKPLYYREAFLDSQLELYMQEKGIAYVALIEPNDFVRWMFPRLFYSRIPRYESIASRYGYTVTTTELARVSNEAEFIALIEVMLGQQNQ